MEVDTQLNEVQEILLSTKKHCGEYKMSQYKEVMTIINFT